VTYQQRESERRDDDREVAAALAKVGGLQVTPEWRIVVALLSGGWPGTLSESEKVAHLTLLGDLDPRQVAVALRNLSAKGQRFRPTPGEVRSSMTPAAGGRDVADRNRAAWLTHWTRVYGEDRARELASESRCWGACQFGPCDCGANEPPQLGAGDR